RWSALVLAALVSVVSGVERRALLAPRSNWGGGPVSMLATALVLSAGVKLWANPDVVLLTIGMGLVTVLWLTALRAVRPGSRVALTG
ncbi:MAG: hypothetical protein OEV40_08350, partial [Acidimicrobiia bacterium]|nr:hypothetical protein [Acidimicrobiia bacterium]